MTPPEWCQQFAAWDAHRAFHINYNMQGQGGHGYSAPLVLFDTGEVTVHTYAHNISYRGHYSHFNISILSTTDNTCPDLYLPDGTALPKAWLAQGGMQTLVIDHDTKHVVALGDVDVAAIPSRFTSTNSGGTRATIGAYFAGAGRLPVGGPIEVSRPLRNAGLTPEQLEHIDRIVSTGQAAGKLLGLTPTTGHCPIEQVLRVDQFTDLPLNCQRQLLKGIGRVITPEPYLVVK